MKILYVDLDLLAKQLNLIGCLKADLQDDYFKKDNQIILDSVLDMLYDIEAYVQEYGEILLKEQQ